MGEISFRKKKRKYKPHLREKLRQESARQNDKLDPLFFLKSPPPRDHMQEEELLEKWNLQQETTEKKSNWNLQLKTMNT